MSFTLQIIIGLAITLIAALIIWIVNNFRKKWFNRPKLFISIDHVLYNQFIRIDHFHFNWLPQVSIKNNSNHTAYEVKVDFPHGYNLEDHRLSLQKALPEHNHLEGNSKVQFELKANIQMHCDDVQNVVYEDLVDGRVRTIYPGMKINDPYNSLMPNKIKVIKIQISYKNEFGGQFFTFYKRKNKKGINNLK